MSKKKTQKEVKKKPTDLIMTSLENAFGKESVLKMKDARPIEVIKTGQLALDYGILGIGGIPKGYFVELYGKEKVGKTSLMLHIMAHCCANNIVPIIIDPKLSAADDVKRAERIGVNLSDTIMVPLKTSEHAVGIVENAIATAQSNGFGVMIFWDDLSLSDTETSTVANKARIVWDFCRSLGGICYKSGTSVIVANHLISKIGSFANLFTTTGGGGSRALSRIRLLLKNKGKWEKSNERIGNKVEVITEANAFYSPYRKAILYLNYVNGYDNAVTILENGVDSKVVTKSRGTYAYKETKGKSDKFSEEILLQISKDIWPEVFGLEKKKKEVINEEDCTLEDLYIDE